MPFDIDKFGEFIKKLLSELLSPPIANIVIKFIDVLLLILCVLAFIYGCVWLIGQIIGQYKEKIEPLHYDPVQKQRVRRRQHFADYMESEVRRINDTEDWASHRFAELEAEVEVEGARRNQLGIVFPWSSGQRYREKSLTTALKNSQERYVILEGEPGSGKSVALRYVAQTMAKKAIDVKRADSIIPIYVNLKGLSRSADEAIDRNLIYRFVIQTIKRVSNREVDTFIDEEFEQGLAEGIWLFLFDSFDEIPEVLSSTEADTTVRSYAAAIQDFLSGMSQCRGVVASRQYRGPRNLGWARCMILALTPQRQKALIEHFEMPAPLAETVLGNLAIANADLVEMASNPMFLSLLCEFIRAHDAFPENVHSVWGAYLEGRLNRDDARVQARFGISAMTLQKVAEIIAFCMTADGNTGLSPKRKILEETVTHQNFVLPGDLSNCLNAIEYLKLGRAETIGTELSDEERRFTFSHRRFQEYFATSIVLCEPHRITVDQLLMDARWRETAVVMCQTQPEAELRPLLTRANELLMEMLDKVNELVEVNKIDLAEALNARQSITKLFDWPIGSLHVLSILQAGFANRPELLHENTRHLANNLLATATLNGALVDRHWTLELVGTASPSIRNTFLIAALNERSLWLHDMVYWQAHQLTEVPEIVIKSFRNSLRDSALCGELRGRRYTVKTQIARLDAKYQLQAYLKLLLWMRIGDVLGTLIALVVLFRILQINPVSVADGSNAGLVLILLFSLPFWLLGLFPQSVSRNLLTFVWYLIVFRAFTYTLILTPLLKSPTNVVIWNVVSFIFMASTLCWIIVAILLEPTPQNPFLWPVLPLVALYRFVEKIIRLIFELRFPSKTQFVNFVHKVIKLIRKYPSTTMIMLLEIPTIYIIFQFPDLVGKLIVFIVIPIVTLFIFTLIVITGAKGLWFVRHQLWWHLWKTHPLARIKNEDFILMIGKLRTSAMMQRQYLIYIQKHHLLEEANTHTMLTDMLVTIENIENETPPTTSFVAFLGTLFRFSPFISPDTQYSKKTKRKGNPRLHSQGFTDRWLSGVSKHECHQVQSALLNGWTFVDEIARLVEERQNSNN